MRRLALRLALASMGLSWTSAVAGPPVSPTHDTLRGYEYVPPVVRPDSVTLAAWRRVAADPLEDLVIRGRALTLLSTTGDLRQEGLIRALMSPTEAPFLQRKALESLARLRGPAVLGEVEAIFLRSGDDPRLRASCARALTRLGPVGGPVRARLRARETDVEIRRLLTVEAGPAPVAPPPLPRRTRP